VTITPATADARNFPNGQVQFYGDGNVSWFVQTPTIGKPYLVRRFQQRIGYGNIASPVSVESNGLASCTGLLNDEFSQYLLEASPLLADLKTDSHQNSRHCGL
jgi:hypothetical protein